VLPTPQSVEYKEKRIKKNRDFLPIKGIFEKEKTTS
jgi:hypothetical protein